MVVKSAIEQVHADDTERFLLFDVGFIKQPHVDDNLAGWAAFLGLKSHAEPSVRFIVLFKTARCHGVRKNAAHQSEEHTSELQSLTNLVCRLLLEKKNSII